MTNYVHTISLGDARITLISIGDLRGDFVAYESPARIPIQSVLIETPQARVLVDTPLYELPPNSPYGIPDYEPPPGLLARLAELGVEPESIEHVIITHAHFDHFNGAALLNGGTYTPSFPRARYYLGRSDWEAPEMQTAIQDASSLAGRTLAVVHQAGQLVPVDGNLQVVPGVEIIATPGESPGHQMIRVQSQGQTLYCIGDLYHFASEVALGDAMPEWGDPVTMLASRQMLNQAALAENALIVATHIAGYGRITPDGDGLRWQEAEV